jgi:hypothetical protein
MIPASPQSCSGLTSVVQDLLGNCKVGTEDFFSGSNQIAPDQNDPWGFFSERTPRLDTDPEMDGSLFLCYFCTYRDMLPCTAYGAYHKIFGVVSQLSWAAAATPVAPRKNTDESANDSQTRMAN